MLIEVSGQRAETSLGLQTWDARNQPGERVAIGAIRDVGPVDAMFGKNFNHRKELQLQQKQQT